PPPPNFLKKKHGISYFQIFVVGCFFFILDCFVYGVDVIRAAGGGGRFDNYFIYFVFFKKNMIKGLLVLPLKLIGKISPYFFWGPVTATPPPATTGRQITL
ncbi:hypothetical protein, partial [Enterobacter intestinihominis]